MLYIAVFGAGPAPVVVAVAIVLAVALIVALVLALFVWRRNRRAGADLDFQPESLIEGLVSSENAFADPAPDMPVATDPMAAMAPVTEPPHQEPQLEPTPEPTRPVMEAEDETPIEPAGEPDADRHGDSIEIDDEVDVELEPADDPPEPETELESSEDTPEPEVDTTELDTGDPQFEFGPSEDTVEEPEEEPETDEPGPDTDEGDDPDQGDVASVPADGHERDPSEHDSFDAPEVAVEHQAEVETEVEGESEADSDQIDAATDSDEPDEPEADADESEAGEDPATRPGDDADGSDPARVFFTTPITDAGDDPETDLDAEPEAEPEAEPDEDVVQPAPVQDLVAHTVIGRMTATGDRRAQFSVLTGIDAERDHALLVQTARIAGDGSIGWTAVRVSPGALEPDLVKLVERTLEETGRAPGDLMLDLPAGQPPTRAMVKTLDGLAEMGIPLGLHGFGSRVDQLLEYGELPLSYVSIDHLALSRFGERGHDIAAQLHRLGHDLGFDAIAVGASTDEDSTEGRRIYRFALGAPSAGAEATGTEEDDPAPESVAEGPPAEPEPPRRRSALHPDFEA